MDIIEFVSAWLILRLVIKIHHSQELIKGK